MSKVDVICLIIAFIVVTSSIIKILPFDFWGFGGGAQAIENSGDTVIATVDGVFIYSLDLAALKYQSQYIHNIELSDQELIQQLVNDQVLYNEADRLGLVVTDQEAIEALNNNYANLELKINDTDQIESKKAGDYLDAIAQTAEAIGLTHEDYKTKIEIPAMKRQMSIAALFDYYKAGLPEQVKADNELMSGQYQIYLENLLAKANIEYY